MLEESYYHSRLAAQTRSLARLNARLVSASKVPNAIDAEPITSRSQDHYSVQAFATYLSESGIPIALGS
jgi:hypothetical protein